MTKRKVGIKEGSNYVGTFGNENHTKNHIAYFEKKLEKEIEPYKRSEISNLSQCHNFSVWIRLYTELICNKLLWSLHRSIGDWEKINDLTFEALKRSIEQEVKQSERIPTKPRLQNMFKALNYVIELRHSIQHGGMPNLMPRKRSKIDMKLLFKLGDPRHYKRTKVIFSLAYELLDLLPKPTIGVYPEEYLNAGKKNNSTITMAEKSVNEFIENRLKGYLISEKSEEENTRIWRYMNLAKFVSLMQKGKLFFPRAKGLPDPFEGATTEANIASRKIDYPQIPEDMYKGTMKHMEVIKKFIFVNSWNIDEDEANLMWESYLKQDFGIAIQSTFKRLRNCFQNNSNLKVRMLKIKYIDFKVEKFSELDGYLYFAHKKKIYKYENELRAITLFMPHERHEIPKEDFTFPGIYVPVNLDTLIKKIVVSPKAELWYVDLVKSIICEYNLKKKVEKSSLDEIPV